MERKPKHDRDTANTNLQHTREAVRDYCGTHETNETIWQSLWKRALRTRVKQFLYKMMHEVYMVGPSWKHIPDFEQRQTCTICNIEENMEHILTEYNSPARQKVWDLAWQTWPNEPRFWPNPSLGIILGVGCLSLPKNNERRENEDQNPQNPPKSRGALRLLQILLSEAAHLIWVLRCERVIQDKDLNEQGITKRWNRVINKRLTSDRLKAHKTKRDKTSPN